MDWTDDQAIIGFGLVANRHKNIVNTVILKITEGDGIRTYYIDKDEILLLAKKIAEIEGESELEPAVDEFVVSATEYKMFRDWIDEHVKKGGE